MNLPHREGTIVLEAGDDPVLMLAKLGQIQAAGGTGSHRTVITCRFGFKTETIRAIAGKCPEVEVLEMGPNWRHDLLSLIQTPLLAYQPASDPYSPPPWEEAVVEGPFLLPWIPPALLPVKPVMHLLPKVSGWLSGRKLLLGEEDWKTLPTLREFEAFPAAKSIPYLSASSRLPQKKVLALPPTTPKLNRESKVLAIVPYFQCRPWLEQCLDSMVHQTRPLDGIVVVDDGTDDSPVDIVKKFKHVSLWRSPENVGPYRLIQSVMEATRYDAYLFQDADDWSSIDRLERLLAEGERTGAELIGTQEFMYLSENLFPNAYPLDGNLVLQESYGYALLHPSSLVSRDLVVRAGGYATGMRFSGDLEFQLRARHAGKIVNLDRFCYFRRIREGSLITSAQTGLASPARRELDSRIRKREKENAERMAVGLQPLLEPLSSVGTIKLETMTGPSLVVR